jgi:hypothetical protein
MRLAHRSRTGASAHDAELSDPVHSVLAMDTPTDRQILEFESRFYLHYGAKVTAIRGELGLSDVCFFKRLRQIVLSRSEELAVEFGPLINRTRRRMDVRQHQRLARPA